MGSGGLAMRRQGSFSQAEYAGKKKQTRRDKFLAEMEVVVPWARLVERLAPLYPKGERGRPPIGLERMLRVYFLQNGTGWPTRRWRMRCMTARPCAALPGSNSAATQCPMRRGSCISAIGWSGTA